MIPVRLPALVGAAVLAVALTGCGAKATEGLRDAPIEDRNTEGAEVLVFPDGFSNVAAKCDGPNRVYVIFKSNSSYGAIAVVADDERCQVR